MKGWSRRGTGLLPRSPPEPLAIFAGSGSKSPGLGAVVRDNASRGPREGDKPRRSPGSGGGFIRSCLYAPLARLSTPA